MLLDTRLIDAPFPSCAAGFLSKHHGQSARMPIGPKRSFVTVTEERQMIPASNHAVWTQIATGAKTINSGKLAINLLVQANKLSYESDRSPANVKQLAAKTYSFLCSLRSYFRTNWPRLSSNPSRIRSLGNYARNRQFNIGNPSRKCNRQ